MVYIDCLNHILSDEIMEGKNVNLVICSLWKICDFGHLVLIISTFEQHLCRLWAHLLYTIYLENCIVPACFSLLVLTLILVSCTVFIAFQCFSSVCVSSVIHLACVCIDYFHSRFTHLQFKLISAFQIFFYIIYQVCLVKNVFIFFIFSIYYGSLSLNTINCPHFCLYSWHETLCSNYFLASNIAYILLQRYFVSGI